MSSRRPLRPLSPLSANFTGPVPTHLDKVGDHEDTHASGSDVSGLTSLENEAGTDAFDLLMMQNEREERRRNALRGQVQPFRKARAQPRVGLTMQNLERHGSYSNGLQGIRSPPSSSGGSDPAVQPPREWGRKARVRKNWLRTITADSEAGAGAEGKGMDIQEETPRQANTRGAVTMVDAPRPSIEDSPLSHKGSRPGTPASSRRPNVHFDRDQSLDFSIDFNEASMIASTPYIPRNTLLDEIRQREIDSLNEQAASEPVLDDMQQSEMDNPNEQAVTTNRLDELRSGSPEETRAPKVPVKDSTEEPRVTSPTKPRLRKAPLPLHKKSSETVGLVDPGLSANAQSNPTRATQKRDESHHLLRRLARLSSSTPSPSGPSASRPHIASEQPQEHGPSERMPESNLAPMKQESASSKQVKDFPPTQLPESGIAPQPVKDTDAANVDATPAPHKPALLNMKTPVVTGAWVDTPAPRTVQTRNESQTRPRSRFPRKQSASVDPQEESSARSAIGPRNQQKTPEVARPTLPRSAVEAIVKEAKMNGNRSETVDEYGDSTIESLEGLMGQDGEGELVELDDDTLQGLQLPTTAPRTEAERKRQQEVAQLLNMRQRLRSTATSVRDANRGLRRVEHQVEHSEGQEQRARTPRTECPCAAEGHHINPWTIAWRGTKRLFYRPENPKRYGLTWLGIASLLFWIWFISETLAW
jgi:hypothetical protein